MKFIDIVKRVKGPLEVDIISIRATCPLHDDKEGRDLFVYYKDKDGGHVECSRGCDFGDIANRLGLNEEDWLRCDGFGIKIGGRSL